MLAREVLCETCAVALGQMQTGNWREGRGSIGPGWPESRSMVMGKEEDKKRAMKEVGVKEPAATASGQIPTRKSPLRVVSDS